MPTSLCIFKELSPAMTLFERCLLQWQLSRVVRPAGNSPPSVSAKLPARELARALPLLTMVVEGGVEVRGFDNPHNLHAVMALMTERLGTLSLSLLQHLQTLNSNASRLRD